MAAETRHIFLTEEEWLAQILSHPGQCSCCVGPLTLGSVAARRRLVLKDELTLFLLSVLGEVEAMPR